MSRIVLVRHGQASFAADDYDRLSPLGHRQGEATGAWLAETGVAPGRVLAGGLSRQRDTATALVRAAGWPLDVEIDVRWNEYDHEAVLTAYRPREQIRAEVMAAADPNAAFAAIHDAALVGWLDPAAAGYDEPYAAFASRVTGVFGELAAAVEPADDLVVVTSGGVIAVLVTHLLGGGAETWKRVQRVAVNGAATHVRVGARGIHLMSFNEASHLRGELHTMR